MKKKINYMGLRELMRMIILFVTFCLKEKIPQGLRGKKYTSQFSLQSKGAVTVEDYWTECQYYDIVMSVFRVWQLQSLLLLLWPSIYNAWCQFIYLL